MNRQLLSRRSLLASAIAFASVSSARSKADRSTEQVAIVTSLGTISVAVDILHAPMSAGNFLEYADRHLFDGAQFYRSVHTENDANPVKISVLQGGMADRTKGLGPIPHESTGQTGLRHLDGTISLARRELGTGSAVAFFICIGDQPELDFGGRRNPDGQGFAAFGRFDKGMDVGNGWQHRCSDNRVAHKNRDRRLQFPAITSFQVNRQRLQSTKNR